MLTAYMDESGSEKSLDWCVVAGFIGSDEQWIRLAEQWKLGLGNRKALHMHDLRWSKGRALQRTGKLLTALGPIPERCGLRRIFGVVRYSDYVSLITGKIRQLLTSPYLVAIHPIIFNTMRYFSNEKIKFVFEQQDRYSPFKDLAVNFYSDVFPARLVGVEYVPKNSASLLQPADYLAFEILQMKRDPVSIKSKLGESILGNREMIGADLDKDTIRQISAMFVSITPTV
jgi:hypothetical protein